MALRTIDYRDGGICGCKTKIHAESDDTQNVTFKIGSGCEKAQAFGQALMARGPVDGYAEIAYMRELAVIWDAGCLLTLGAQWCYISPHNESQRGMTMVKLEVFDPPMCCSSGVCGPKGDRGCCVLPPIWNG